MGAKLAALGNSPFTEQHEFDPRNGRQIIKLPTVGNHPKEGKRRRISSISEDANHGDGSCPARMNCPRISAPPSFCGEGMILLAMAASNKCHYFDIIGQNMA